MQRNGRWVPMGAAMALATMSVVVAVGVAAGPGPTSPASAQEPPAGPGLLPVPGPIPAGAPGDLIDSAPFDPGGFAFEVEPHQILFHSRDRAGNDIPVSGLVLVPVGIPEPAGGRSVVAWAHGTVGLIDGCAPSLAAQYGGRLNSPDSYDRIDDVLAAGHIVVASDYPGLGTPGVHPYLDGVGEGRSVLDSIRAARSFGGNDVAVVQGFSQGSQAAIFAGQEWATYAPELDLRAIVAIGTPSRYGQAFGALELPVVQSYIGKVLAGLVAGHPELDRRDILTPSGEAAYDAFAALDTPENGWCNDPDFDLARDLAADPMSIPAWRAALEANDPGRQVVPVPVLMIQSEADEQALAFLADGVCRDLVANGSDVRMWRFDDESHVATVSTSATDRMTWILDRLADEPLTDAVPFAGEAPQVLPGCPGDAEVPPTPTTPDGPPTTASPGESTTPLAVGARPRSGRPAYTG